MTGPIVGTEILTFKEGDLWVAAWIRRDFVGQGSSEHLAVDRLLRTIALTAILNTEEGKEPIDDLAPPPERLAYYHRAHGAEHPKGLDHA